MIELLDAVRTLGEDLVELGQLNLVEFIFLTLTIPIALEAYRSFSNRNVRIVALHDIKREMLEQIDFLFIPKGVDTLSDFARLIEDRILRLENGTANLSALYGHILKKNDLVQIGGSFIEIKAFLKRMGRYASEQQFALLPTADLEWPSTKLLETFQCFVGAEEVDRIWNRGDRNIKGLADETAKRKFDENKRWIDERDKSAQP